MTNTCMLTIVICTYNDGSYLTNAVSSVISQTKRNWELIIVNDGSEDNTKTILDSLVWNPSVRIIHNRVNLGKAACLNIALNEAKGEWLMELDADDWLPNKCTVKLEEQILALSNDVALIYGKYKEWRERTRDGALFFSKIHGRKYVDLMQYINNPTPIAPRVYKMDLLRKSNGWCLSDMYGGRMYEDIYMVCTISKLGKVEFVNDVLYHRRLRKNSISNKTSANYISWKKWMMSTLIKGSE
ncbi:glycosyltransferase [Sutcliffiella horikoshii]|uniref:glycosyltransferase family 2 protein n=1 Tax=Sutcliffiella horikoshii TaxID=79883 RepID=UPI001CBC2183|nr:glycosyltransferase family 2 protein [Sutcliffiella horikoshii]UAL48675.1 glycosyltransferase [Sutcliffiella horikoshii]